jgi:DNA processing protein
MKETTALIALSRLKSLNRIEKRRIMEGLPQVAPLFEGRPRLHSDEAMREISAFRGWEDLDAELETLGKMGASVVTIRDPDYPAPLRTIPDPPLVLYRKGSFSMEGLMIAVVGSRRATAEGLNLSEKIADTLSSLGVTVVSGLARGIDAAAHRGALPGKGKTVAVLGCGLDICYPWEHKPLFEKIGNEGVLISEYGLRERPLAYHFPERNRIIAGLSKSVLVIEATEKSGSLITARLGLEYGRDVMAVPGSIFSQEHKGTNSLIKQGAKLVDTIEDIVSEVFPGRKIIRKEPPVDMDGNESYIYSIIGPEKIHVDEVIDKSKMAAKEVMAILTMLEMKEVIREIVGGFYIRR